MIFKTKTPFVSGVRLESLDNPPVSTMQHGGRTDSQWDHDYGRQDLEL